MKRSKHSLSHYKLATFSQGELIPVACYEVLPGDTVQQATSALLRATPLNAPVMHPVHARIHHWYVPTRLIWNDWENFITGGPDGLNASVVPTITVNSGSGWAIGSLADYLGIPTGVDDLPVCALPFRAYALIWNEWYRDQDLQTALTIDLTDGADTTTNTTLQNVCWERDYFTTSRPWTQKGTAVSLPLGTRANVLGIGKLDQTFGNAQNTVYESDGTQQTYAANENAGPIDASAAADRFLVEEGGGARGGTTGYPNIYADLSTATSATINELREAFALQRYKEARARYGSRFTEYLRYLGIRPSDARLQRPEYLGGGKQTIQFSEVLQQAPSTSGTPGTGVGILKGHGIGAMRSNRYRRFFEEHGYVISLLSVQPKTMYAQGLPKMWSRSTKEDYWQKELQFIGQEEVYNKEIYWGHSTPNGVFGYNDRYDSYRRIENSISGEFRDSTANFWHMGRIFSGDPALNAAFVSSNPTNRVYQSTSTDQIYAMINHSIQARRLVAKMGTSSVF